MTAHNLLFTLEPFGEPGAGSSPAGWLAVRSSIGRALNGSPALPLSSIGRLLDESAVLMAKRQKPQSKCWHCGLRGVPVFRHGKVCCRFCGAVLPAK